MVSAGLEASSASVSMSDPVEDMTNQPVLWSIRRTALSCLGGDNDAHRMLVQSQRPGLDLFGLPRHAYADQKLPVESPVQVLDTHVALADAPLVDSNEHASWWAHASDG